MLTAIHPLNGKRRCRLCRALPSSSATRSVLALTTLITTFDSICNIKSSIKELHKFIFYPQNFSNLFFNFRNFPNFTIDLILWTIFVRFSWMKKKCELNDEKNVFEIRRTYSKFGRTSDKRYNQLADWCCGSFWFYLSHLSSANKSLCCCGRCELLLNDSGYMFIFFLLFFVENNYDQTRFINKNVG